MPIRKCHDYWIQQSTKQYSFDSQYELGDEIGRGATSIVYNCERRGLKQPWAVKLLQKNTDKRVCATDAGLLLNLDHKNLVRLKEIFESRSKIFLVQELVTGGELFDRIVNMDVYSETVAAKAVKDIISGLDYLHNWEYALKNLKPENLLYENTSEDSRLKISDFALSAIVGPDVDMSSVCGSPEYTAPEVLKGDRYGKAGDMWSVGVIIYILLCGYEPFKSDNPSQLFKQILKGQYEFLSPDWDNTSFNSRDLIYKLLVVDPKRRLTSAATLGNNWVNANASKSTHMLEVVDKLKLFNERRREKARHGGPLQVISIHPNINSRFLLSPS